ncbi:unnamed protein product [Cylicocyclus nassatus]|uniref:G-protein coupled receptors family 1 profile domain-containing protein n=1 Tax=Cylicocyclus nassatus TaxID=53992 RepID=A0AA36M858_CYLNA|nr:unnamed protein product [Cylicocyclus nassatus]
MNLTDWSVKAYVETPATTMTTTSASLSSPTSSSATMSSPSLASSVFSTVATEMLSTMASAMMTSSTATSTVDDNDIRVIMLNNSAQSGVSIENLTVEETCRFRNTNENYVIVFTFITIFLLSVIGNVLVIVVILQQRAMRSITNIYLMNLAITDLMLSVVCMPPTLFSMVMNCWIFGNLLCKVFAYLQPMVVTASAYTLAVIAFERYYAICRPLHSRIWQTRSHAYAMIMLVWVIALVANVHMLAMYEELPYNGNGLMCAPRFAYIYYFVNQVYIFIVLLVIPLVIMTVLYGSVIRTLKLGIQVEIAAVDSVDQESKRSESPDENDNQQKEKLTFFQKLTRKLRIGKKSGVVKTRDSTARKRSDVPPLEGSLRSTHIQKSALAKQRVIKMLIVVVIIFFCCWTPSYIWWLILTAGDSFESLGLNVWNSDLNTFITLLTYISSCTNPITYCFLNKKFRTAIYAMFGKKKVLRHHFQKVYFLVNAPQTPQLPHDNRPMINRSVSSTFNPPRPVDSSARSPLTLARSISQTKPSNYRVA